MKTGKIPTGILPVRFWANGKAISNLLLIPICSAHAKEGEGIIGWTHFFIKLKSTMFSKNFCPRSLFSTLLMFCTVLTIPFSCTQPQKEPLADPEMFSMKIEYAKVKYDDDQKLFVAYINWGRPTVKPQFLVSEGASCIPASGQEVKTTAPVVYTVTNAEGAQTKYKLIFCSVSWGFAEIKSETKLSFHHFSNPEEEKWSAHSNDGRVFISFEHIPPVSPILNEEYFGINLNFRHNAQLFAGTTYPVVFGTIPSVGEASATFSVLNSSGFTAVSVSGGELEITKYDPDLGVISGKFSEIIYDPDNHNPYPYKSLMGNFENLPIRIEW